jgi:hypothetical protein
MLFMRILFHSYVAVHSSCVCILLLFVFTHSFYTQTLTYLYLLLPLFYRALALIAILNPSIILFLYLSYVFRMSTLTFFSSLQTDSLTLSAPSTLGGASRTRTDHLLRARQALYQMSYGPSLILSSAFCLSHLPLVGLGGLEPPTSPLSGVRSNQLSYKPISLNLVRIDSSLLSTKQIV